MVRMAAPIFVEYLRIAKSHPASFSGASVASPLTYDRVRVVAVCDESCHREVQIKRGEGMFRLIETGAYESFSPGFSRGVLYDEVVGQDFPPKLDSVVLECGLE
ncbi:MAG: hypothetical protein NVS3B16_22870 [Vulcanimicrobiaceae bacterium]